MRSRFIASLTFVLLAAFALAAFASSSDSAGKGEAAGYSVSVSLVEEAGGEYIAKALVRAQGGKVVAAPAVRARSGSAAETESTGPGGKPRVTFRVKMGADSPTAEYEVQIFDGDVRQAHHQAQITLHR